MTTFRYIGMLALLACAAVTHAAEASSTPGEYHLFTRDLIRVSIFNEPEMTIDRRVDGGGAITLPLLGAIGIRGLTVSQAEDKIQHAYVEKEIFVSPQVSITILEYLPKEVSVIGQVKTPGKIVFPIEDDSLEIVDVISKAGGVTRIARSDSVRVTRKSATGEEVTFTVDVERMFDGRGGAKSFLVIPGDVIFVPERIL